MSKEKYLHLLAESRQALVTVTLTQYFIRQYFQSKNTERTLEDYRKFKIIAALHHPNYQYDIMY